MRLSLSSFISRVTSATSEIMCSLWCLSRSIRLRMRSICAVRSSPFPDCVTTSGGRWWTCIQGAYPLGQTADVPNCTAMHNLAGGISQVYSYRVNQDKGQGTRDKGQGTREKAKEDDAAVANQNIECRRRLSQLADAGCCDYPRSWAVRQSGRCLTAAKYGDVLGHALCTWFLQKIRRDGAIGRAIRCPAWDSTMSSVVKL
jgi:hypothetical protein